MQGMQSEVVVGALVSMGSPSSPAGRADRISLEVLPHLEYCDSFTCLVIGCVDGNEFN